MIARGIILAIDTSSQNLSLALYKEKVLIDKIDSLSGLQHGTQLVPQIQQLLLQNNLIPTQIACIVIGRGPGSYTGIRIGLTAAKMWAVAAKIPLIQVSSLALMAATCRYPFQGLIIPLMDARRLSAYLGLYAWSDKENKVISVSQDTHSDWASWIDERIDLLKEARSIALIGYQIEPFAKFLNETYPELLIEVYDQEAHLPSASKVLMVEAQLVKDPDTLEPNYGQMTLAEREWLMKDSSKGVKLDDLVDLEY